MPLAGQGKHKREIFAQGLLHASAHIWIWRRAHDGIKILLQKRAANKRTWPGRYDISAAGHVDAGEEPLAAALREIREEIGLSITSTQLQLFGVHRAQLTTDDDVVENEFQWLYLLELSGEHTFELGEAEVASLQWIPLDVFKTACTSGRYVPHGQQYYERLVAAIAYTSARN